MHQHDSSTGTAAQGAALAAARTATGDTSPADILRPYTVTAAARREARLCWIGREVLEPGTAAFLDGDGLAVCAGCAAHCATCASQECDHPRYAYLAGVRQVAALPVVVAEAAAALRTAYGRDVEIRYDDDGVRGGAWLRTADGGNADAGIAASAIAADTPEGTVAVYAHIRGLAVREALRAELAALAGWRGQDTTGVRGGYHHGPAESVQDALARVLRFVPPQDAR